MCYHSDQFYACGCRYIDPKTNDYLRVTQRCEKAKRKNRDCPPAKPLDLRWQLSEEYCDNPNCPAQQDDNNQISVEAEERQENSSEHPIIGS
ncbi:uncharacterized protein PG998_000724 [Apiospora kogelbergensis]|uniref:Uncharacterized protein n=1 Tax=Apiospora kogelbergensis TaxID=1337665 RepID=A0AAW0QWH2_9PEZI